MGFSSGWEADYDKTEGMRGNITCDDCYFACMEKSVVSDGKKGGVQRDISCCTVLILWNRAVLGQGLPLPRGRSSVCCYPFHHTSHSYGCLVPRLPFSSEAPRKLSGDQTGF